MLDTLKSKFDACFILTLSHRRDRQQSMERQMLSMGVDLRIGGWARFWYATRFPYNDIIVEAFNNNRKGRFSSPNEYDCARNHYAMVKTSMDLGYKNVLILEDDVLFLNDMELFRQYIEGIPDDYDIVQFNGYIADKRFTADATGSGDLYFEHAGIGVWNAAAYAISRNGMKYYLGEQDRKLWVADGPLFNAGKNACVKTYLTSVPLVIQDSDSCSDLRRPEDLKGIERRNRYERDISRSNYGLK